MDFSIFLDLLKKSPHQVILKAKIKQITLVVKDLLFFYFSIILFLRDKILVSIFPYMDSLIPIPLFLNLAIIFLIFFIFKDLRILSFIILIIGYTLMKINFQNILNE